MTSLAVLSAPSRSRRPDRNGRAAKTVSVYTLGCRLNHAESGSLAGSLATLGFHVVGEDPTADLCIINTCAVTHEAEVQFHALLRRVLRANPNAFIVVTGCLAQIDVERLRTVPGIDLIAGADHKMVLPALIQKTPMIKRDAPLIFHTRRIRQDDFTIPVPATYDSLTRPNIKIQDGCNFFCSFCIIPYTRGRERSRPLSDVMMEAEIWAKQGHREIVLTGVNLGQYRAEGNDLADLIDALSTINGLDRIRISSIEPTTVSDRILDQMAASRKLCPHLHLPLQSGSNAVLSNMGRHYTREAYIDFVKRAYESIPDLGLGTDVMVGFPGETENDFEQTVQLIEALPFSYLHIFPFSERKGTRLHRMSLAPVDPRIIKARVKRLHDLSREKKTAFYRQYLGKSVEVLFEQADENGLFSGFTGNYMRVAVQSDLPLAGTVHAVWIRSI